MTAVWRQVTCLWPESVTSRGSAEIGSCMQYLRLMASDARNLIVSSDACGGQICIINIACLWTYVVFSDLLIVSAK